MSDVPFSPGKSRDVPLAFPFTPGSGPVPGSALPGSDYPGPGFFLIATGNDPDWEADAAIAIATAWSAAGRRVVLADLQVDDPRLHERLGLPNLEGVVDIFLYGASLSRNARVVPGRDFFFVAAGTYSADPERVFTHPRWRKLVTGFREAEASILLFVRAGSGDLEPLAAWVRSGILLGSGDAGGVPEGVDVRTALIPPGTEARGASAEDEDVHPADVDGSSDGSFGFDWDDPSAESSAGADVSEPPPHAERAELGGAESVDPMAAPHEPVRPTKPAQEPEPISALAPATPSEDQEAPSLDVEPASSTRSDTPALSVTEDPLALPPDPRLEGRRRGRREGNARLTRLILGTLVLMIAAGVLVYLLVTQYPDLFAARGDPTTSPAAQAEDPRPAAVEPAGAALQYAVFAKSFNTLEGAREHAAEENRARRTIPFYVVPERRQGVLHFLVMAGFAADTMQALQIRQHLVEAGSVDPEDAAGEWALIQHRPLAFYFNEIRTREAATEAVDNLWAVGVPAYAVPLPYTDGSERWRLYGGAYPDSARAEDMREMISAANLPARLIERVGRSPSQGG
jgi:hypothetical protein